VIGHEVQEQWYQGEACCEIIDPVGPLHPLPILYSIILRKSKRSAQQDEKRRSFECSRSVHASHYVMRRELVRARIQPKVSTSP
jgi:hypothetical protein